MNQNISPRKRFQASTENIAAHKAMISSEALRASLDSALLEMSYEITANPPADMGGAASGYLRILGAQEFIHLFLNLAETPDVAKATDSTNLPSNIRPLRK